GTPAGGSSQSAARSRRGHRIHARRPQGSRLGPPAGLRPPRRQAAQHPAGGGKWTAKLTDFGLAKSFAEAGASFMTQRGEWCGTLLFMAPEQILNYRYVKPPADLYSLGVTYYYLITGRLPFEFPSALDRAQGRGDPRKAKDEVRIILEDDPIPVRNRKREVPEALAAVIDKSIRKREQERFQTAAEMRSAMDKALR